MELRKIDPTKIVVPEVRVTSQFDAELFEQFKDSIKATGQITPPVCYEVEGEVVLCDGLHRIEEAIKAGEPLIDVVIIPGDMIDVLTKNIFLDHLRGKTPVSQMVTVIKVLYNNYNLDIEQIQAKTGLTQGYIEKLLKIGLASSSIQEALDQGVIGVGHAFEISRLPFAIQQDEVMAKHQIWRFTVKELKEQVDAVLHQMDAIKEEAPAAGPGQPRPAPTYHCEGCKNEMDPRYLRPSMLCPECFGAVWRLRKVHETTVETSEKVEGGD